MLPEQPNLTGRGTRGPRCGLERRLEIELLWTLPLLSGVDRAQQGLDLLVEKP
jgi:hypothetical protein